MASNTLEPCDCGVVTDILNYPEISGVTFDENYGFLIGTAGGNYCMYYCPFCGGRLPDGSKPIWYPQFTPQERSRVERLIEGITTPEQAFERLGPPDYDAVMQYYEALDGGAPIIGADINLEDDPNFILNEELSKTRNIEYYNLSEHLNIELYFDVQYGVKSQILLKNLPPRHIDSESDHSTDRTH